MEHGCCGSGNRSFLTREEKLEMLKDYKETLEREAKGVMERIKELEKANDALIAAVKAYFGGNYSAAVSQANSAYSFGEDAYKMNISSTKSMTGHLLGAAGAVESIAAIMSIIHGIVPPTINHFTDDPQLDPKLNFTFNVAQHREINAALSNTFGFGGHNASVIFKKFVA